MAGSESDCDVPPSDSECHENKSFIQTDPDSARDTAKNSCFRSVIVKALRLDIVPCIPARYVLLVLGFWTFTVDYTLRINLSMAIIDMDYLGWNSKQQGWVLSSFFYGYITTQVFGGYLASKYGGRYVIAIGLGVTTLLSLLIPLASQTHYAALIAVRVMQGVFEGLTHPAMYAILGMWAPPKERTVLIAIAHSGISLGHIIGFMGSAVLCEYAGGWSSVFYVQGGAGLVWLIFWLYLGYSSPATHPRISENERLYIETSIKEDQERGESNSADEPQIPWFEIFTSPAVWAICVAHFCLNWGLVTLMTCIPSFFQESLSFSLENSLIDNGIFCSVPYVGYLVVTIISSQLADSLRQSCVPTVVVRKAFTSIGLIGAAGFLLLIGCLGSNRIITVSLLTASVSIVAMCMAGFLVNHVDIAPQYAGILYGITNTVSTIPGMLAPLVAKTIAHEPKPFQDYFATYLLEWQQVFVITAEVYIFGALVYLILGRADRQRWAGGDDHVRIKVAKKTVGKESADDGCAATDGERKETKTFSNAKKD